MKILEWSICRENNVRVMRKIFFRWQSGFFHYPAQQECLVDVLWQMHYYRVYLDKETGELLKNIIGMDSAPYR